MSDAAAGLELLRATEPSPRDYLAETVGAFRRWLFLPDASPLLAVLGAVSANLREGDPVWLLLVGPPGGGKSEIVQSLAERSRRGLPRAAGRCFSGLQPADGSRLGLSRVDRPVDVRGRQGAVVQSPVIPGLLNHRDLQACSGPARAIPVCLGVLASAGTVIVHFVDLLTEEALLEAPTNRSPKVRDDPREAGRLGGVRSGEARRAKRDAQPRHWHDELLDQLSEDPRRVVRALLSSKNGAALAKALELARDIERSKMRHLQDLDRRTSQLDELCCQLMDDVEQEQARKDRLRAEVAELGRQHRELREAIAAEAAEHNFEWVDGGGDDGLAPAV